jgi:hypothetical protein
MLQVEFLSEPALRHHAESCIILCLSLPVGLRCESCIKSSFSCLLQIGFTVQHHATDCFYSGLQCTGLHIVLYHAEYCSTVYDASVYLLQIELTAHLAMVSFVLKALKAESRIISCFFLSLCMLEVWFTVYNAESRIISYFSLCMLQVSFTVQCSMLNLVLYPVVLFVC